MRVGWDRGTLVLEGEAAAGLPGVLWDPRTQGHRAPAWRLPQVVAAARERGLDPDVRVHEALPPPRVTAPPELRPYQAAAVAAWSAAERRGTVVLPTGAGKTRTAIAAIVATGARALVLAPTRVLVAQWVETLEAAGLGPVGWYGDGHRVEEPVTVCTFASARAWMPVLGNRFDLLVVDECHHFGAEGGDEPLEMCAAPMRLGLTATPPEDPTRLGRLGRLVGQVVFRSTVDALAGAYLAPFDLVTLRLSFTPAERAAYDAAVATYRPAVQDFFRATPGADWARLVVALSQSDAGRAALRALKRSRELVAFPAAKRGVVRELLRRHAGQRLLVFTADNEAAYDVARRELVAPITCDVGKAERAEVLARFADGRLTALVSARVLNEGVDVPAAEVAVLVAGSQGSREYVQRIGRVLRPAEGKRALVYELMIDGTHEAGGLARGRRRLAGDEPVAVPPGR